MKITQLFAAALWLSAAQALPGQTLTLSVARSDRVMQVNVPLPAEFKTGGTASWQLTEAGANTPPVPASILPAADGRARLLANLPPTQADKATRRFQLERSAPGKGDRHLRFDAAGEKSVALLEGARRVLVYNHGVISKGGVPADRNRSSYLHPIYGLDGEVLTDDFPRDHYHHRGLFWAWPHVKAGDKEYDLWALKGIGHRFEKWLAREAGPAGAVLGVENGWYAGDRKVMQERVWLYVYASTGDEQAVDVDLTLVPLAEPVTLSGAEGKSYGGLTLRFAPCTNVVITTPLGNGKQDLPMTKLPWADFSAQFRGPSQASGAAILISPEHPDFPPMWLTRHYGVLCIGWPGVEPKTFPVGQPVRCQYRVWIHRRAPDQATLEKVFQAYQQALKASVEGRGGAKFETRNSKSE